jgi:hypothetical protein
MVREQNQGLALELGGHEFKPKMNTKSLELAATMKSLSVRMPEMLEKREKFLKTRRNEQLAVRCVSRYLILRITRWLMIAGANKPVPIQTRDYCEEDRRLLEENGPARSTHTRRFASL